VHPPPGGPMTYPSAATRPCPRSPQFPCRFAGYDLHAHGVKAGKLGQERAACMRPPSGTTDDANRIRGPVGLSTPGALPQGACQAAGDDVFARMAALKCRQGLASPRATALASPAQP
jgi:hypothetical protein